MGGDTVSTAGMRIWIGGRSNFGFVLLHSLAVAGQPIKTDTQLNEMRRVPIW